VQRGRNDKPGDFDDTSYGSIGSVRRSAMLLLSTME
jgi:hypothetical protein